MAMTKRLGAYADIAAAFDAALAHQGGTLTFPTVGAARNWRQRAYYYRQLLGTSKPEYDGLQLVLDGTNVTLSLLQLTATFTAPSGEVVNVAVNASDPRKPAEQPKPDSLLADALALVQTHKG